MTEKNRRLVYTVPYGLAERIREFAAENEFRNERDAMSALIEGALEQYPRWGVRKGLARVVSSEMRGIVLIKMREKLTELSREIDELMSTPAASDMDPNAPAADEWGD